MRAALGALAALGLLVVDARSADAAPRDSDVARLTAGLPADFRRPRVVLYPLLDQAALAEAAPGTADPTAPPPVWAAFVSALQRYGNLDVVPPIATRKQITRAPGYEKALTLANEMRALGEEEYRAVRLESAARRLGAAVEAYLDLQHDVVDPAAVGRALLFRGLALLEAGDRIQAEAVLRRALMVDPTLRLRPGYDRPESVAALERAREALLAAGPPAPDSFSLTGDHRGNASRRTWVVFARRVDDRLELAIHGPTGVSLEVQPAGADPADAGERLASRVWACLPFGSPPDAPRHRPKLFLDAGFEGFTWLQGPVDPFTNLGVGLNLSWVAAPFVALDLHLGLTNSGRDREEDLRGDVATIRGWMGPGFHYDADRFRATATVGIEVASPGALVITTDADCKLFGADADVPRALCDPAVDIERFERAVMVGPLLAIGAAVRLVDQFYFTARVAISKDLYSTEDNGLGWPLGGHVGLGYRLY